MEVSIIEILNLLTLFFYATLEEIVKMRVNNNEKWRLSQYLGELID